MKNIKCNICEVDNTKFLFEKNGYNIVRCNICGLAYVNPQPETGETFREYQEFYKERFSPKKKSKLRDARREIKRIKKLFSGREMFSLLDIGCGCGFLLKVAQDNGWDATGIDMCEWEVEYAKKEFGVKVEVKLFSDVNFSEESFNVITMFDLIEHLSDPMKGLKKCFNLLSCNGVLIVGTPDFGHPKARKKGEKWEHLYPPQHLFYFSLPILKSLAEKTGFKYKGSFFKVPWKDGIKAVFQKL